MNLGDLIRSDFPTSFGTVPLWHPPVAPDSTRPALITIAPAFADDEYMTRLPAVLGDAADVFLMHMPGNHAPVLSGASVGVFAKALGEVLAQAFGSRRVVLFGLGIGAVVALATRSPAIRRVVAVEPLLSMATLWPQISSLQASVRAETATPASRDFIAGVYGVTADGVNDLRHHHLLSGLQAPADVLLGAEPLHPPRTITRLPSLVGEDDRTLLRELAGTDVRVAPETGHRVPSQAPEFLRQTLLRACREAARPRPLSTLQSALLGRVPTDAASVAYVGGAPDAFRDAWLARNPNSQFIEGAGRSKAADILVVEDLALIDANEGVFDRLAPGGHLIAASSRGALRRTAAELAALVREGFAVDRVQPIAPVNETFDDWSHDLTEQWRRGDLEAATDDSDLLVIARKGANAAADSLHLRMVSFVPRLMDIRARLPALGLRAQPELVVTFQKAPFRFPDIPVEQPKLQILQRPVTKDVDTWRNAIAQSISRGWLVILDYDDHPELIARMNGTPDGPEVWTAFSYVHAVQTSTPNLADAIRTRNPEVRLFPNAVFERAPFPTASPRRVFYGAVRRGQFGVDVMRSLAPVAQSFPDVEFVVVGDRNVFDATPSPTKTFYDYLPYEDYLDLMGTCAISLSPIEGLPLQDTKSDAKFLDASARGVLTLASPTVYTGTIRHGVTGLIANTVEDWAPLLSHALGNDKERRRIARNAWDYVRKSRMFAQQVAIRRDWYRELWNRRDVLNQAVMTRHPEVAAELARLQMQNA